MSVEPLRRRCGQCLAYLVDDECPNGHPRPPDPALTPGERGYLEETIRSVGGTPADALPLTVQIYNPDDHARTDLPRVQPGAELLLIWREKMRPILERMRDEAPVIEQMDFIKVIESTQTMLEVLANWKGANHGESV